MRASGPAGRTGGSAAAAAARRSAARTARVGVPKSLLPMLRMRAGAGSAGAATVQTPATGWHTPGRQRETRRTKGIAWRSAVGSAAVTVDWWSASDRSESLSCVRCDDRLAEEEEATWLAGRRFRRTRMGQRDEPLGKRAAPVRRSVEQINTNSTIHRLTAKRHMVVGQTDVQA